MDGKPVVGFKEWSLVCRAMAIGRQSLILRKGGIHEGRGGFEFEHRSFFLYPTEFHAQRERIRPGEIVALDAAAGTAVGTASDERVETRLFAEMVDGFRVVEPDRVAALAPFHIWTDDVVRERFDYGDQACLHAALVRVYRLATPWAMPYERRFGGCRSWIELPEPPPEIMEGMLAVVDDEAFAAVRDAVVAAAGATAYRARPGEES